MQVTEEQRRLEEARLRTAQLKQQLLQLKLDRARFQFEHEQKEAEVFLEERRQMNRPSQHFSVKIYRRRRDGLFICNRDGIKATGETPEMACDNFDHLWVFGDG